MAFCEREGHAWRAGASGKVCTRCGKVRTEGPAHYTRLDPEPIEVIEKWGLGYALGNVVKYIGRAGNKPGNSRTQDLQKAQWYLDREVHRAHRAQKTP